MEIEEGLDDLSSDTRSKDFGLASGPLVEGVGTNREIEVSINERNMSEDNEHILDVLENGHQVEECQIAAHAESLSVEDPYVGMQFPSIEDAYNFYSDYAFHKGFKVRKSTSGLSKINKAVISKVLCCSKQGFREKKNYEKGDRIEPNCAEARTGCKAFIVVKRRKEPPNELWEITKFESEHNHVLIAPNISQIVSQKKPRVIQNLCVDNLPSLGPRLVTAFESIKDKNDTFSDHNRLNPEHKSQNSIGRDIRATIQWCNDMRRRNPGFFYAIDVDNEGGIDKLFWIDTKSRIKYKYFGEVVSFNAIYMTNLGNIPFVIVTGCNHHRQTILFGAGFLLSETVDAYIWLFTTWLEAVDGEPPSTIMTDHDDTMASAIAQVFTASNHHVCLWDIFSKLPDKLNHITSVDEPFRSEFYACYKLSKTMAQFEERWQKITGRYFDPWLQSLYDIRQRWVPLCTRQTFTAGMTRIKRQKNVDALLDGFSSKQTTLHQLVQAYEKVISHQHNQEYDADYNNISITPVLKGCIPMEQQLASLYTREVFILFQEELQLCALYVCLELNRFGQFKVYSVKGCKPNAETHFVTFHAGADTITCSCLKFESEGILCRHALKVYVINNVLELPETYILGRWTREAEAQNIHYLHKNNFQEDNCRSFTRRYDDLCKRAYSCVEDAVASVDIYDVGTKTMDRCLESIFSTKNETISPGPQTESSNVQEVDNLGSTSEVSKKYCSSMAENMGSSPLAAKRPKNSYSCPLCKVDNHCRKSCPILAMSQPENDYLTFSEEE